VISTTTPLRFSILVPRFWKIETPRFVCDLHAKEYVATSSKVKVTPPFS
jgi:hypothetical protein